MAFRSLLVLLLVSALPSDTAVHAEAQVTPELPSSKQEISNALEALRDRYGLGAVRLESFLLQYAIEGGSVLTTSVGVRGIEESDGRSYLQVDFDTGIIYAPPEVQRSQAPARVWLDIVDPTLRQLREMQIEADGILLFVRFRYSEESAREVLRERRQDQLPVDVVSFRMLCEEIVDAVRAEATTAELVERAVVRLNDRPMSLQLDEISTGRTPKGAVTPPLPVPREAPF